jgi:hypothetical protein
MSVAPPAGSVAERHPPRRAPRAETSVCALPSDFNGGTSRCVVREIGSAAAADESNVHLSLEHVPTVAGEQQAFLLGRR